MEAALPRPRFSSPPIVVVALPVFKTEFTRLAALRVERQAQRIFETYQLNGRGSQATFMVTSDASHPGAVTADQWERALGRNNVKRSFIPEVSAPLAQDSVQVIAGEVVRSQLSVLVVKGLEELYFLPAVLADLVCGELDQIQESERMEKGQIIHYGAVRVLILGEPPTSTPILNPFS